MRRIYRSHRSIDHLLVRGTLPKPSTYLCSACAHSSTPFSTTSPRSASNGKVTLTEKLRRKIWGTDNPPGLEDPYGDTSVFDQTKKKERVRESEEKNVAKIAEDDEMDNDMQAYQPASNWDGLERVGWTDDRWDPANLYTPFVPFEVKTDEEEITAALHRAMVEVYALKEAGVPLGNMSSAAPGQDLTLDVTFCQESAGPTLKFLDAAPPLEDLVESITMAADETVEHEQPPESEEDVAADPSDVDPLHPEAEAVQEDIHENRNPTESEEDVDADRSPKDPLHHANSVEVTHEELFAAWGQSWLQMSLQDPEVKFAVLKRMMQLTGIRIPDAHLALSRTPAALLKTLVVPPKPRKLVDALSQKEDLVTLPNVSIYPKRITPIDREKSLGRWKVIEQELEEKGLPVTGHETKVARL